MRRITTIRFTSSMYEQGSWGHRELGSHESEMTLYLTPDRSRGAIEWDIETLGKTEEIGLWFEADELIDYDGVMALPKQAADLLRSYAFKVEDDE